MLKGATVQGNVGQAHAESGSTSHGGNPSLTSKAQVSCAVEQQLAAFGYRCGVSERAVSVLQGSEGGTSLWP